LHIRTIILIVFLLIYALLAWVGLLHYDGADGVVFDVFTTGRLSNDTNVVPNTFGYLTGFSHIINWLSKRLPCILWYDLLIFCGAYIGFSAVFMHFLAVYKAEKPWPNKLVVFSVALLFFVYFLINIQVTKIIFLLLTVSLLKIRSAENRLFFQSAPWLFFILVGSLMRIEVGILCLLIGFLYFSIAEFPTLLKDVKAGLFKLLFPILPVVIPLLAFIMPINETDQQYLKIRPYENALVDFDRESADVQLRSQRDSVLFNSAINFFHADTQHLNSKFYHSIGIKPADKSVIGIINRMIMLTKVDRWQNIYKVARDLRWVILFWFIGLVLGITKLSNRRNILLANLVTIAFLLIISVLLKAVEHVIGPVFFLLILYNSRAFLSVLLHDNLRHYLFVGALLLLCSLEIIRQYSVSKEIKIWNDSFVSNLVEVKKYKPQEGVLLLNISVWDRAHSRLFSNRELYKIGKVATLDGAIMYLNKDYNNHLTDLTGQSSFFSHWDALLKNKNTLIFSSEERMNLILRHLNTLYGTKYKCSSIHFFEQTGLHLFKCEL
jgi:hypothetical protein